MYYAHVAMAILPKKVAERLIAGIKRFQPIVSASKARDDGEGDTVMVVTDMLGEVFGYDKYSELTAEHAVRGTYCDLATKLDGTIQALIEVKAVGLELKEQHVKQAVDYAANQGVDWVILTNAGHWRVYNVTFAKPIGQELVIDIEARGNRWGKSRRSAQKNRKGRPQVPSDQSRASRKFRPVTGKSIVRPAVGFECLPKPLPNKSGSTRLLNGWVYCRS
jgi:hypothetical protein